MKKILLFFVFIGTSSFAQVQQRNQIGAIYHLGYSALNYQKSDDNSGFNKVMDSLQTTGLTQGIGISYVRRLNRELTLLSGLQLQAFRFNFKANTLPSLNKYQQQLDYLSIPLGIEYNYITDTWQPFIGFSIVSSYLIRSQIAYTPQAVWNEIQATSYNPVKSFQMGAVLNIGAQLPVSLKWSFKPSVMLSYGTNSLGTSIAPQRPYQLAFQLAVLNNLK